MIDLLVPLKRFCRFDIILHFLDLSFVVETVEVAILKNHEAIYFVKLPLAGAVPDFVHLIWNSLVFCGWVHPARVV